MDTLRQQLDQAEEKISDLDEAIKKKDAEVIVCIIIELLAYLNWVTGIHLYTCMSFIQSWVIFNHHGLHHDVFYMIFPVSHLLCQFCN